MELAFESPDGLDLFVVEIGNVYNEIRGNIPVLDGMEDLFGAPGLLLAAVLVVCFDHTQPGVEASLRRPAAPPRP